MNTLIEWLNLLVVVLLAIWSVYQTRLTKNLEEKIHRLSIELDQSIQILYRAREAVIKVHDAHVRMLLYGTSPTDIDEGFRTKLSEWSAYDAELRGLAIAIGDKKFLDIVNEGYSFYEKPLNERVFYQDEVMLRSRSQRLHTRISELLKNATK